MAMNRTCDGIRRRDLLKVGVLGGMSLNLASYLQMAAAGEVKNSKAKAAIFVELNGGPTHMDTFDLKPDAPAEYRGEFNPIDTNVSGVQISEHLPKLATCADKYTILRGVSHNVAAHALGRKYMNTGNRPIPALEYPGYGAIVTKELDADPQLPKAVAVPRATQGAGYLGVRYAPLETNATPRAGQPFNVRGVSVGRDYTVADIERRQGLLNDLDVAFKGFEESNDLVGGLDEFHKQVYSMITSSKARAAFDLTQESPGFAGQFGESALGQSCLLATRLVESGVKFVTVQFGGWDTHQGNFERLKTNLLPTIDTALTGLFQGLAEKGLLESTVVMVTGEFGRTPKINARGGRDHWARAMFVLMAGGGIRGGRVLGASDDKGMGPASTAITPEQVAASYLHALGIDYQKEYQTNTGRPMMIVRNGALVPELFG